MATLYTIGHSNRSLHDFLEILIAHNITDLIDVRSIPKSRNVPWFNKNMLEKALRKINIHYEHLPELGGLRHAKKDSENMGWRNTSFRGFADYMQTQVFFAGLKKLNTLLKKPNRVAIMCAEAVPWRCHRSLIADAETIRHIRVLDIFSKTTIHRHVLTSFAVVNRKKRPMRIIYRNSKNQS